MSTVLKTACVALTIATPSFTFGSPFRPILRPSFVAEGPKSLKAEVAPEDGTTLGLSLGEFMRRAREFLRAGNPLLSLTEPDRRSGKAKEDEIGTMLRQGAGLEAWPVDDEELFGVGIAPKTTVAAALSIAVAKRSGKIRSILLIWTSAPESAQQAVTLFGTLVATLTPLTAEQLMALLATLKIRGGDFQPMVAMQPFSEAINNVIYQCVSVPIGGAIANACSAKPSRRATAPQ